MIHVVKPREAKQRNSFGVAFDLLAIGPRSMVTKMHYQKENVIPFHSHPNEQIGSVMLRQMNRENLFTELKWRNISRGKTLSRQLLVKNF